MKVGLKWLTEFVEVREELEQAAYDLTMLGLEVDRIDSLVDNGTLEGMVVGRILTLERHPRASKLWAAQVDIGERELSVISAAENLFEGALVPVILPGHKLPDGTVVESQEFRGVPSEAMMVSASELGLPELDREASTETAEEGSPDEGILILDGGEPGAQLAEILELEGPVLELDLTPNYASHAQSMLGVARELGARRERPHSCPGEVPEGVRPGEAPSVAQYASCSEAASEERATVTLVDDELCSRYSALLIDDVTITKSPLWMRTRLLQAGIRPINNVVDITNYVMMELGQPLHAFDYDALVDGHVLVRTAEEGETLVTLDGDERELLPEDLLIATDDGAVGLAGVMGGLDSEVTGDTTTILLESAHFDATSILKTARRLSLWTEASRRFEKGMDRNMTVPALLRCAQLFAQLGAGTPASTVIDEAVPRPEKGRVQLRVPRANELLGVELTVEEVGELLERLGFAAEPVEASRGPEVLSVGLSSHRPDVETEIDLVEEVARLYGYDKLPTTVPTGAPSGDFPAYEDQLIRTIRRLLTGAGLNEMLTFSFTDPAVAERMGWESDDPRAPQIPLANPMTRENSYLRASLTPSILEVLAHNARQRVTDVAVFEVGRLYRTEKLPLASLPEEPLSIGIGLMGRRVPRAWNMEDREADFYELKGVVECLLEGLGVADYSFRAESQEHLHPGRTAALVVDDKTAGWLGEVHPEVAERYELPARAYVAELNFRVVAAAAELTAQWEPIPNVPPVVRDVAVVVGDSTTAEQVRRIMEEASGELVESIELFDVYTGEGIPEGHRSLAFTVTYRGDDTLTEQEVAAAHDELRQALLTSLDAELRS